MCELKVTWSCWCL